MPWFLVDATLVLLGTVALVVCAFRLWKGVKALGREVADAGTTVGDATEKLAVLQADLQRGALERSAPAPAVVTSRPAARRRQVGR